MKVRRGEERIDYLHIKIHNRDRRKKYVAEDRKFRDIRHGYMYVML